ncbi:unnamed protein product, partial [Durusdinium trenchii]
MCLEGRKEVAIQMTCISMSTRRISGRRSMPLAMRPAPAIGTPWPGAALREDPQGWQRKVPFSAPSPRYQPTMAWSSAAGGLYMLGGINRRVQLNDPNDLYLYVPEANQWQKINATGDAPSPRYGHTMGWSSDAGLYVFGGRQLLVNGRGDHNDLYLYAHEANQWQKVNALGDAPSPRYRHTMAWSSAAGGLYLFGGF